MSDPIRHALALWGLNGARSHFIAGRENRVYRVQTHDQDLAFRLKRPDYRSDAELLSELQWMAAMGPAGLSVPRPVPLRSGALLECIGDQRVDVLRWLAGEPMGLAVTSATLFGLGQQIARLHDACDMWSPPEGFTRCKWDTDGLLGEAPVWGRFWDNPSLDLDTKGVLEAFRGAARADFDLHAGRLDHGLIHADLVGENVLMDGDAFTFIDFDDGGYGYRMFDLATVLLKHHRAPDFDKLTAALLDGYRSIRVLNTRHMDLFLALRAVTYVGWIAPRVGEAGGAERAIRLIATARTMCRRYLNVRSP